ncbi:ABC transporter ATP-binding protein [Corynebacterium pacaense]|uniref:ABC transporter ATP-binding protein n=1 Tax=Corynebacterium pacaense TaxID=1816684 RepID=UPI0009BA9D7E|nr:ABC transporter ATP-binding protein [Corynebacterium pacaense]
MTAILRVRDLVKSYGSLTAVDGLSFDVWGGMIFAFLGSNGAGKTTTISCLTGIISADSGTVEIAGPASQIGVVFQQSVLDPLLTARENLQTRAGLYPGVAPGRIEEVIESIGIGEFADRRYGVLSGGEKRRTDIARALLPDPAVLFLDEPTAGLDPRSRHQVWDSINALRTETGLTVFLTTHYMEETEIADQVLIIDRGRKVAEGTPLELRGRYTRTQLTMRVADAASTATGLPGARADGDLVHLEVASGLEAARIATAVEGVLDVEIRHGSMDEVFLAVTGGRA